LEESLCSIEIEADKMEEVYQIQQAKGPKLRNGKQALQTMQQSGRTHTQVWSKPLQAVFPRDCNADRVQKIQLRKNMTTNDTLSAALSKIMNAEQVGKKDCILKPTSSTIKRILDIMKQNDYVGEYREIADGRGGMLQVHLIGNINKCGSIKPRFSTQLNEFEKWEKRFLPARGFGILLLTTPKGIMTHEEAKTQGVGGQLLAYCY
jgi:small subunit ribosomal protein S8